MDAPHERGVKRTIVMSSAQVGKTEIVNNTLGYHIDHDPCPCLVVQPTLDMAETWSKDRLAPMIRDTPSVKEKVSGAKGRDSANTILHKSFPGGHVTAAGANAPPSLASRPVRLVLCDEIDRYPGSAGTEGDPVKLAEKRANTFWNRKIILVSTPTVKGASRIESEWELSDKRRFHIPCPHCGTEHILAWGNVRFEKADTSKARMVCPSCEGEFTNAQKNAAVRRGRWIATAPFKGIAGFHLNELYSPWKTIQEVVDDFLEAKDDPLKLQVWVNTSLGETWEGQGESVSEHELMERVENYPAEVPARGLYLTAGADVQPDRIEVEVIAWGSGEESWSIDYHVIRGDIDIPEGHPNSPWTAFTDYVRKRWEHESGVDIAVSCTFIDSGGTDGATQSVYNYVKRHRGDRIFAIKGRGGEGLPIVGPPNRKRSGKKGRPVDLYIIGTDTAKSVIIRRLKQTDPGPGYCHFPAGRDPDWFRQLTAEKAVTKFVKGFRKVTFEKPKDRRNEALDCRVYAFGAFVMDSPQLDKIAFRLKQRAAAFKQPKPKPEPEDEEPMIEARPKSDKTPLDPPKGDEDSPKKPRRAKRRGSFVKSW
jgi:phage terminase large subunit GpA-like protein